MRDHVLLRAFIHSAVLIVFYAVIPVIIGLLLTAALTRTAIRGFRFFRTTLFLPQLIAGVVIAQAWVVGLRRERARSTAASSSSGSARSCGRGSATSRGRCRRSASSGPGSRSGSAWCSSSRACRRSRSSCTTRRASTEPGAFREFFAVTLPGLRNEILVAFVLTTINALRSFDMIYNTTAGGPGEHDDRPLDVHVPERVSLQPRRVRGRDRDDPRDRRSSSSPRSCSASATGARSGEGGPRSRRIGTYIVLGRVRDHRDLPRPLDPLPRPAHEERPRDRVRRSRRTPISRASRPPGRRATSRPGSSRASSSPPR